MGSLGDSLKIVFDSLQQLQRVNINICQQVERSLAPLIVKQLMNLLEEVLQHGLDHEVDQSQAKGVKKYSNAAAINDQLSAAHNDAQQVRAYFFDKLRFKFDSLRSLSESSK